MTSMEEMRQTQNMITQGTVPLHPGVVDYKDAKGKIILFVRDDEEGRSLFLGIETYGEISRLYEVDYADWQPVMTKMAGDVIMYNHDDPFMALLEGTK